MPGTAKVEQYDVSPVERQRIAERAQLRASLRKEFLKIADNPHRMATNEGGYGFDPVLQRWLSMRAQHWHYFKPNPKTLIYPVFIVSLCFSYGWLLGWDREKREKKIRAGEVSYRQRENKFV